MNDDSKEVIIPETPYNDNNLRNIGFLTAAEYSICNFNQWKKISFGCSNLDRITNGGLQRSGITEISGKAGSGKTQICMQLSLMVQLSEEFGGSKKGAVYICTEHSFPTQRAMQIIDSLKIKYPIYKNYEFLDNIFIQHILGWEKLIACVESQLEKLMHQKNIALIIIDSIAAIFRATDLSTVDRAYIMRNIINKLIQISIKFECAILCTNQISSFLYERESIAVPSLGLAWSNLINNRIIINKEINSFSTNIRKFEIKFSPYLKKCSIFFKITTDGIVNI